MSLPDYLLLMVGMGAVTYLPRFIPLALLSRRQLPRWLADWLDLVPAAILSAIIAPILFTAEKTRTLDLGRKELLVAVPTLLFALKTRSLAGTVIVGMGLYWLAGMVMG
ncbi:AzlD domain-containing protein [Geobacter sp. AOG1]|uniref:AzlD domain-containing protein n=1 Tax=Geobacter sp. AOG1 TaxID=1566346 RepID=UPI001CC4B7A3|nr:AzlD domain-containing protein [Geobacter sp. AOG1]GFE56764.1 AzlD family membrane protein [Geobacter sp. AOG1]